MKIIKLTKYKGGLIMKKSMILLLIVIVAISVLIGGCKPKPCFGPERTYGCSAFFIPDCDQCLTRTSAESDGKCPDDMTKCAKTSYDPICKVAPLPDGTDLTEKCCYSCTDMPAITV